MERVNQVHHFEFLLREHIGAILGGDTGKGIGVNGVNFPILVWVHQNPWQGSQRAQRSSHQFPSQSCHQYNQRVFLPFSKPRVEKQRFATWGEKDNGLRQWSPPGLNIRITGEIYMVPSHSPLNNHIWILDQRAVPYKAPQVIPVYSKVWQPLVPGAYENSGFFGSQTSNISTLIIYALQSQCS